MTPKNASKNRQHTLLSELDSLHARDFSFKSGRILGSMCTQPHPLAKKAYIKFFETNLGDPELFPGTKEIESRFLSFIAELLHAPSTAVGQIVSGGTEGNMTAMWMAKQLTHKTEIILPESVHFSFQKIASLMGMKLVKIPLQKDFTVSISDVRKKICSTTAAVVGIAGSTELGTIDSIPELSDICGDEHIFLHVDAAFGGFVIPFLKKLHYPVPDFDFALPGVTTVSVDSHKMGYSAIPLGTLFLRNRKWLDTISVDSPYISSEKQSGILGTRSGGPVAAAYAVYRYLGWEGYTAVVKRCMDLTQYTEDKIKHIGLSLVTKPTMNVLGIKLKHPQNVVKELSLLGWKVNKINRLSCIRIVLMPHITKPIIDDFIPLLQKTCQKVGEL